MGLIGGEQTFWKKRFHFVITTGARCQMRRQFVTSRFPEPRAPDTRRAGSRLHPVSFSRLGPRRLETLLAELVRPILIARFKRTSGRIHSPPRPVTRIW
jgi:hypothetical protein